MCMAEVVTLSSTRTRLVECNESVYGGGGSVNHRRGQDWSSVMKACKADVGQSIIVADESSPKPDVVREICHKTLVEVSRKSVWRELVPG